MTPPPTGWQLASFTVLSDPVFSGLLPFTVTCHSGIQEIASVARWLAGRAKQWGAGGWLGLSSGRWGVLLKGVDWP